MAYLGALLRFTEHGPTTLLVSTPDHLVLAEVHQTLAGIEETAVESHETPIDLNEAVYGWAEQIGRTLGFFREVNIVAAQPAGKWIKRLSVDPRRSGTPGYRLLQTYRPEDPRRDPLAPPPPSEADLDDPAAARCLLRTEIPRDNLPRPLWYAFDARKTAERFKSDYLLLISLDHLTVIDTGGRPKVQAKASAFLVDLDAPLLAAHFPFDFDLTRAEGPAGPEAALCGSLAELRADDWAALKKSLVPLGDRYGFILAAQLGWITPEHLAQEAHRWQKENERVINRQLDTE